MELRRSAYQTYEDTDKLNDIRVSYSIEATEDSVTHSNTRGYDNRYRLVQSYYH